MRYSKPLVLRTDHAVNTVRQQGNFGTAGKIDLGYQDQDKVPCTQGAYEADE